MWMRFPQFSTILLAVSRFLEAACHNSRHVELAGHDFERILSPDHEATGQETTERGTPTGDGQEAAAQRACRSLGIQRGERANRRWAAFRCREFVALPCPGALDHRLVPERRRLSV